MYALVDCNNFFVSCERVFRPELEGRAVVVLSNNDGCVVARSNESKAMGIKMGTPFYQVSHLVEKGRLDVCSSNYTLYGDMSSRVMSILSDTVPKIEIYSIDEAFLHLDGLSKEKIPGLCSDLVRKIRKWTGIPVSIGVAPTKTLAKIASHFAKKYKGYRGVCLIDNEEKRRKALKLTPIQEVWGIGRRLAPRLVNAAVNTAWDYVSRPETWIRENFNIPGLRTWMELRGVECTAEEQTMARKSVCTSRSFAEMIEDEEEISRKVSDFAAHCARKLREEGTAAQEVTTFLYTNRFRKDLKQYFPSAAVRLDPAASNTQEIVSAALRALKTIYRHGYQYKKAGVIVSDIVPADAVQSVLFDFDPKQRAKNDRMSEIMDRVNSGRGASLLRLASQKSGDYTSDIRSEHRSRLYSTSLDELVIFAK